MSKILPDPIYLQLEINAYDNPVMDDPFDEIDGATWCADRINESDVQYLLATPERLAAAELLAVVDWLVSWSYPDTDCGYLSDIITEAKRVLTSASKAQGENGE